MKEYLGMNGIAAGPIELGPSSPWLVGSGGSLHILDTFSTESKGYCPVYAGTPAVDASTFEVATTAWVRAFATNLANGQANKIDLSVYAEKTAVNFINKVLFQNNVIGDYTALGLVDRVNALENFDSTVGITLNNMKKQIKQAVTTSETAINSMQSLTDRLDSISKNQIDGEVIFKAGGAIV